MIELMHEIQQLRIIVSSDELRELSKPLSPHDFQIYKKNRQKLNELEKRLINIKEREEGQVETIVKPKVQVLSNVNCAQI